MRSVTSFFDLTLYKKDMSRFWPLWVLYTVIWLFMLPLNLLSSYAYNTNFNFARWAGREPLSMVVNGPGLFLAVVYGLLCAGAVWLFLYNNRSANLMHSLPARRETHFVTHTAAGVTFFLLPYAVTFFATLAAELVCGSVHLGVLAAALGCQTMMTFFFFAFATLCAFLTGHILGLPAFYAIFNFIVWVMSYLADWLCTFFVYGYTNGLTDSFAVILLTPIRLIAESLDYAQVYLMDPNGQLILDETGQKVSAGHYRVEGAGVLAVLTLVGVVLLFLALLLYRKRHMETAGDTVAVPFLRPVFLYCVGICGSLAGGCVTYLALGLQGLTFLVLCLVIWAVIFWFAGMMLLHKTFRVFKNGWWGCAVTVCVVLALCGALQVDLFGLERWVPNPNDVVSVSVSGPNTFPYDRAQYMNAESDDPAAIAAAVAAHQAVVDERSYLQKLAAEHENAGYRYTDAQEELVDSSMGKFTDFTVRYTMANGRIIKRSYELIWLEQANLSDPASLESRFTFLLNDRSLIHNRYRLSQLEDGALMGVAVEDKSAYSAVCLKVKGADFHYAPPTWYVGEFTDEYLARVEELYGITEADLRADPELLQKFIADDFNSTYVVTDSREIATEEILGGEVEAFFTETELSEANAEALRKAILSDFAAGNLGVRYLFDGDPARLDNTYVADLEIMYKTVEYEYYYEDGLPAAQTKPYYSTSSFTVTLTPQAKATIAALKAAGAFADSGVTLRTNGGTLHQP